MPDMVVDKLIHAALDAMEGLEEPYTNRQLLSAVFTVALRVIQSMQTGHPELQAEIRQAATRLLLEAADHRLPN